ncbi:hypothetical protein PGB90_005722 [Kerria lacca]
MYIAHLELRKDSVFINKLKLLPILKCSVGDSYPSYRSCVRKCYTVNCKNDESTFYLPSSNQNFLIKLLWSCHDNCEYECMWPMVRTCLKNNWNVPQFNGKWPFMRWLGMQEPASAIFSLFNLVSSISMYRQFYKAVRNISSMYWIWTMHVVVSINTWFWSIIFHVRDIPFTERMDYISASSFIYYTFYAFGYRILLFQNLFTKILFICGCLFFFVQHIMYLIMKPFDYHYNLDNLLLIGITTGIGTLFWCIYNWKNIHHVKYAAMYVTLTMLVALFEIFDFAPILWTFDAHSLWHLMTIPLPYFLYK